MFCPKCGNADQSPESYCRQCGEWLPNLEDTGKAGFFRVTTREEKVRKIRTLELISIGLSLTSAMIIFAFLFGNIDRGLLFLALASGLVVAVYQAASMYMGHKVLRGLPRGPAEKEKPAAVELPPAATKQLNTPASVVEKTTELLDKVPVAGRIAR